MLKKTTEKTKRLLVLILITAFIFSPLDWGEMSKLLVVAQVFEDEYESIFEDTTWGPGDHVITRGVFVENGATLTIEKGARIVFKKTSDDNPFFLIDDGKVLALGSDSQKITFDFADESSKNYQILIQANPENEASFFRHVDFIGGGIGGEGGGGIMGLAKKSIINTVMASEISGLAMLQYQTGKIHIENSRFLRNNNFAVSVDSYVGQGYNEDGFMEIVNSNFENNIQNLGVTSSLRCTQGQSYCSDKFLLKNNWYGDFLGPELVGSTITSGVKMEGDFKLEGWRGNDLIADPALIVPGIMGAGQFLGSWQLDPITHSYDDLVASLEENGFIKNVNLFDFPYDWRNNNQTNARFLQSRIEGIIRDTKVSKVDVVAHSMGGLIARAYVEEIEGAQYRETIDELITLGTPQKGSPEAYLKWEAGEGFFTWSDKLAKHHFKQEAEHAGYDDLKLYIQEKIPSVRQLLPDYDYLFNKGDGQMRIYPENYPRNTFLEDLNLEDNLEKMKKIRLVNILGVLESDKSTISKIRLIDSEIAEKWEHGMPENFYNDNTDQGLEFSYGDETVPRYSAKAISADKMIEIESSHQELPTKAQCEILEELTGKTQCNYVDDWHMTNILLFNVFSPIDIQIISPSGKKYGKNFENNTIFENNDGSFYSGFETENEFLTIPNPEEGEYRIITKGTDDGGAYRVEIVKLSEDPNDSSKTVESMISLSGNAIANETQEDKVEVKGDAVVEIKIVVADNEKDDVPAILPPVAPPDSSAVQSQGGSIVSNSKSSSSHKKKKSHKKKVKKKTVKKVTTKVKKVLGISTSKNAKSKSFWAASWKNVTKKTSSNWNFVAKSAKKFKEIITKPFKYFKK